VDKDGAECSRSLYSRIVLVAYSTCLVSRIIGVLLGVLGGAAAPPSCWRSRKFLGCRKFPGVGQKF